MACLRLRCTSKCIKLLLMCAAIVKTYGVPSPGTLFFFVYTTACMYMSKVYINLPTYPSK